MGGKEKGKKGGGAERGQKGSRGRDSSAVVGVVDFTFFSSHFLQLSKTMFRRVRLF